LTGDGPAGIVTALELLGSDAVVPEPVESGDLFGQAKPPAAANAVSTGGRPRGSRNRRTEESVAWLTRSLGTTPLEALLRQALKPPRDLAEELELFAVDPETGIQRRDRLRPGALLDVWSRQQASLAAALPYMHQKLPISVNTDGKTAAVIVLGDMQGVQDDGDGHLVINIENTQQSGSGADAVGRPQSDAEAIAMKQLENASDAT
jgi:hypothetical protein